MVDTCYQLRYDLEPCVNVNGLEPLSDRVVYIRIMSVVKPQGQQSEGGGVSDNNLYM